MDTIQSDSQKVIYDEIESLIDDYNEENKDLNEFLSFVNDMRKNSKIQYYMPISSNKKVVGSVVVAAKKAMRRSLGWLIGPIIEQQSNFNVMATQALLKQVKQVKTVVEDGQIYAYYLAQREKIENLETLLSKKEEQINAIESVLSQVSTALANSGGAAAGTFSQAGEDSIIQYILEFLKIPLQDITYLDLGANHAMALSNTYRFYAKGAKGVLVEANPLLIPELKTVRPRDLILNKCVDTVSGKKVPFYILNGDGVSTTDLEAAEKFCELNPHLKIIKTVEVETITINEVIGQYMEAAPTILSIDIEGKDREILESIDDDKRPFIIITEMIDYSFSKLTHETKNKELYEILLQRGYEEFAFTGINSIFIDSRVKDKYYKENL
jgi:methyltransferase, FkbM family